ncbi:hypothetical protein ACLKA7_002403 [Drosophila subpalustris]
MLRDSNGIYTIKVFGLESFEVLCDADLAGPGWTVIASRSKCELNFFRNWAEYKHGFGSLTGDFFIGLDKLHAITVSQSHELYIYLEDFEGNKRFARYDEFLIGTETDKYVMAKLGTYVGDMGDSLSYHAKMKFTTYDSDNDSSGSNCAVERMGAWWYNDCTYSNLFGLYLNGTYLSSLSYRGMYWYNWRGYQYSYKVMRMMTVLLSFGHFIEGPPGEVSSSSDTNHEVQSGEDNLNMLRLYKELDKLNELFVEHLTINYNNYTPPGNDIKAVDIVRKVLDSNRIDSLDTLRSSCPIYRDSNGIYTIKVFGLEPFEVLCDSDLAGPGWTVIASRSNIELNFFRNWAEYKRGFGNLTGDFFIGLDKLHAITVSQPHELYIYLEDFEGNKRFARYDEFLIGTETDKYVMAKLGTYVGDMGDSLREHANKKFTTYDSDNDDDSNTNCAITNMGAWWYGCNVYSNLFGLYLNGTHASTLDYKGICWYLWGKAAYSYKVMRMMVKPKCSCSQ